MHRPNTTHFAVLLGDREIARGAQVLVFHTQKTDAA